MDIMLPSWSIAGIAVLLLSLVIYIVRAYINGDIVPRKQYDAVQKMSDQWQRAWEINQEQVQTFTVLAETLKHFLDSLPPGGGHDST